MERPELGVTELTKILGYNKSVVHKIAVTLEAEGFLRRPPGSRRYEIGPAVLEIAAAWLNRTPVVREGTAVLGQLVQDCGMSGGLGIIEGRDVFYLAAVEAEVALKATSRVGDRQPLHATATGKCILAFLPAEEREDLLARINLVRLTARTTTDLDVLRRSLVSIKQLGYAFTRGERVAGLAGVAAPVWDHRGRVVAAISVAIPENLIDAAVERCIQLTVAAGQHLSARLGYTSNRADRIKSTDPVSTSLDSPRRAKP
jgi:DNA-binding IclR family transcriptional regulator